MGDLHEMSTITRAIKGVNAQGRGIKRTEVYDQQINGTGHVMRNGEG